MRHSKWERCLGETKGFTDGFDQVVGLMLLVGHARWISSTRLEMYS